MAKPKSVKLRNLIILRTLFKYSDANHPVGLAEINEQLRPHALDCDRRSMNDTLETLEEFGVKISKNTRKFVCKVWPENPLLSDSDISCLVFALMTNPHISKEQTAKILEKMKQFVTVYQEPLLSDNVELAKENGADDSQWRVFSAIQEACFKKQKIQYTKNLLKCDKNTKHVTIEQSVPIWFTPRCFYRVGQELYMVGFKKSSSLPHAVALKDITSIRIPNRPVYARTAQMSMTNSDILADVNIPHGNIITIYKGSVTFRCRGSYLQMLYSRFGPPSNPIKKDARSITTYHIEDLILYDEDLYWLSQIPGFAIRIIGPESVVGTIRAYYNRNANNLTDPFFLTIEQNNTEQ